MMLSQQAPRSSDLFFDPHGPGCQSVAFPIVFEYYSTIADAPTFCETLLFDADAMGGVLGALSARRNFDLNEAAVNPNFD